MAKEKILVVDDEKNMRITLKHCLEGAGYEVTTAVNGEDALDKFKSDGYQLVLLDMKLPGISGIEVLKKIKEERAFTPVIMITAYGTIETAVEAMKLGAVDYLSKPFPPEEIRGLASKVLSRKDLKREELKDFDSHLEFAKACINKGEYETALEYLQKAMDIDPSRPEPLNLMGVFLELQGNRLEALKRYRAALGLDPTYEPARKNLDRATSSTFIGEMDSGEEKGESERDQI